MYATVGGATRSHYHQGKYQNYSKWRPSMQSSMQYPRSNNVHHNMIADERYWCETCDRGFPTLELLEKHKQQHQKCNIDGCQFIAHPKVITKHIQMQHSTGLYKRIAKLDNPEEIKKWIEERKKKYPTKLNIDKKNAQIKEKIERGEKMGLPSKGNHKFNSSGIPTKRKHNFNNDQCHKKNNELSNFHKSKSHCKINAFKKQLEPREVHNNLMPDYSKKLQPFAGIQNICMEKENEEYVEQTDNVCLFIDDDIDETSEVTANQDPQRPTVCSALSALMCSYESSEEETEIGNKNNENKLNCINTIGSFKELETECKPHELSTMVEPSSKENDNVENGNENKSFDGTRIPFEVSTSEQRLLVVPAIVKSTTESNDKDKSDNDSEPEEVKIEKNTILDTSNMPNQYKYAPGSMKKRITSNNNFRQACHKRKPKIPSTLLQKLLHREMQHERNIVLQCIHYIVKNNYFNE